MSILTLGRKAARFTLAAMAGLTTLGVLALAVYLAQQGHLTRVSVPVALLLLAFALMLAVAPWCTLVAVRARVDHR